MNDDTYTHALIFADTCNSRKDDPVNQRSPEQIFQSFLFVPGCFASRIKKINFGLYKFFKSTSVERKRRSTNRI